MLQERKEEIKPKDKMELFLLIHIYIGLEELEDIQIKE
jgi:hypothetical protein